MHEDLIEQFKAERKKQGLSQEKVADNCNVTLSAISKVELGDRVPSLNTFMEMCKGLGFMVAFIPIPPQTIRKEVKEVIVEVEKKTNDVDWDNFNEEE